MKKTALIVLAAVLVFCLMMTACDEVDLEEVFSSSTDNETTYSSVGPDTSSDSKTSAELSTEGDYLPVYNAQDEIIKWIRWDHLKWVTLGNANVLSDEETASFKASYEDAKAIDDKIVKYFVWVDIRKPAVLPEDWAYILIEFPCTGDNVEATINGNPIVIDDLGNNRYGAHISEFGAVAVMCD